MLSQACAAEILGTHFAGRKASVTTWALTPASKTCLIPTPPNLQSAILPHSWLKTGPAPRRQHPAEPQPCHPPPPPLPMLPTTTSMSPKSDDLVASAPLLSPSLLPWRWELATCSVLLLFTLITSLLYPPKGFPTSCLHPSALSFHATRPPASRSGSLAASCLFTLAHQPISFSNPHFTHFSSLIIFFFQVKSLAAALLLLHLLFAKPIEMMLLLLHNLSILPHLYEEGFFLFILSLSSRSSLVF